MFAAFGNGGVMLGVSESLDGAIKFLESVAVGWIMAGGKIIHKKGF